MALKPNKIEFPNGSVLIDLTADTVAPEKMYKGITAHAADGTTITGTAEVTDDGQGNVTLPAGFLTLTGG